MAERYVPNGTPLTDYERELLVCVMEECAEIIQAASKLVRFGKENRPDNNVSNTEVLSAEVGDLLAVLERTVKASLIDPDVISDGVDQKRARLDKYLQTSPAKPEPEDGG